MMVQHNVKIIVKILVLALIPIMGYSQNSTPELESYAPVSPNAASLGQYGLFPANHNLGTVNAGVPIYTINTGKQTMDISLSYNTKGIRVNELASWVGLGWTLNAGGAIIRNTKGIPENIKATSDIIDLNNAAFNQTNYDYMFRVWSGQKDSQTDEFIINAPGISGTFYFDFSNGNSIVFSDRTKANVTIVSSTEIEVVRTDGTTLRFGTALDNHDATEISTIPANNYINAYDYVSAWYLTEMISPKGDVIKFKYKAKNNTGDYPVAGGESVVQPSAESVKGTYPNIRYSDKKYLERIEFENGHVLFNSALGRQDLDDEYRLDNIKVYSGNFGGANVTLVEEYTFNYSYFTRSGGSYPDGHWGALGSAFTGTRLVNSRTKSLKLDKVIIGKNGVGHEYAFEYNSTTLPLRGSTKQDQWGYANTNTGSLLLPTSGTFSTTSSLGAAGPPISYNVGTGDRNGNESKMKAASLQKITYPTGGYTVFEYDTYTHTYQTTEQVEVGKNASVVAYGTGCNSNYGSSEANTSFTVGSQYVDGSGKLHIYFAPVTAHGNGFTRAEYDNQVYSGPTNGSMAELSYTVDVDFSTGMHTLEAYQYGSGNFSAYGCPITSIMATWREYDGTTNTITHNDVYGGLRIKSIKNYDGVSSTPVAIKEFEYEGVNVLQPKKSRGETSFFLNNNRQLNQLISTNVVYDNNIGSRPVVEYGKVTEYNISISDASDNGKTVYYYNTVASRRLLELGSPIPFKHPQFDITDIDEYGLLTVLFDNALNTDTYSFFRTDNWRYGTLDKKEIYKNTGTIQNPSYTKVSTTENQYTEQVTSDIKINLISKIYLGPDFDDGLWVGPSSNHIYGRNNYHFSYFVGEISLGRKALSQTITKDYDVNGSNPVIKTTNYFYENLNHLLPTKTETTNSRGELLKTTTSYAHDVGNQTLINKNRIAEPIQVKSFKKIGTNPEKQLSEHRTIYNSFGSNYLPEYIRTSKGNGTLENRIVYHDYDSKGNPLQVNKESGAPISYIWGYGEQYPVAKVENATHAQVVATLTPGELTDVKNGIANEATMRSTLNKIRSGLPNALVTTYTYDPLVGVTSTTDPGGRTIYYVYDSFNRLKEVRDQNNELVTDYEYHYKNQ
ncbi:SpvB/TcaC N-terminal domain-containing protein [Flagellimonas pacifica]|uniref:YD repeat-containing protein n=1 Tax=Flagellimonas pacifica TaxID=1247520 RepID=A0A285MR69_9FLAO|nr:SpvB/TcaC N-terminal domain-containing protein [Allomuricauda parva]SNY99679.1 YD repeat-containing protein [Allomuricauda parva]